MKMVINKEMSEAELIVAVGAGHEHSLVAVLIVALHVSSFAGETNIVDIGERRGIEVAQATRVPAVLHHFLEDRSRHLIVDERDELDYVVPFSHVNRDR